MSAGEDRVEHQVGQHIQRNGHVLGQRLDVEADGLLAGEGVQVAADRVHLAGNVLRGAGTGALEEHVLDKVGDAVGLGGSQREPDLIHTPMATERIYSMRSVSTIRPLGSTVRRRFRSVVIVLQWTSIVGQMHGCRIWAKCGAWRGNALC
jgi:hypothetical protein